MRFESLAGLGIWRPETFSFGPVRYLVPVLDGLSRVMGLMSLPGGHVFSVSFVIPDPEPSHAAKMMDIHMIVATDGRERTTKEYATLHVDTGWEYVDTHYPGNERMGDVEGVATYPRPLRLSIP